ncbi:MAG: rhomboid family intramembrane serine protease [Bacteroidales bacterium]|jgi:membrane associated rhomboid family serine protease|nr:rhomboid family intramembrane serine protease [Bacteroidales bacterium]
MNSFQNRQDFKLDFKDRLKDFFRSQSPLNRLIVINVVVYLLILFVGVLLHLIRFLGGVGGSEFVLDTLILDWFGVSAHFGLLMGRPWTLITSIFLHLDFFHILFNMIMLWFSGRIFLRFFFPRQIYVVYIVGGILGNIFFVLSYNFFPVFESIVSVSRAIGASGGVLAVLIAAAVKAPNYSLQFPLIGRIALKWIALFFVIIDVISIPNGNSGGHFAHLGGAIGGFLYVYLPRLNHFSDIKLATKRKKQTKTSFRPKTDEQYNAERAAYREKVDAILDKVAKSGYQSLKQEEKDFLFKTSNKQNW